MYEIRLIILTTFLNILTGDAKNCYSCTWTIGWPDRSCDILDQELDEEGYIRYDSCADTTSATCQSGCPKDSCVKDAREVNNTIRQVACADGWKCAVQLEYLKGTRYVRTFYRGCVPAGAVPHDRNDCTESAEFFTCNTACADDLCNDGSGLPPGASIPTTPRPWRPRNQGNGKHCRTYWSLSLSTLAVVALIHIKDKWA